MRGNPLPGIVMAQMIHPTAIVHPEARLASGVEVGPYAVIDAGVELGPDCWIGPHVHLTGRTRIGAGNRFHSGCVIGDAPQDLRYHGEPTSLRIGDRNVFREHTTVHRSNTEAEETVVGSDCLVMAHAHVGHNARVGNRVILANGALIGGHAQIGDRAFLSGNCLVHQFVRVGELAMMQGGAGISLDLPPFTVGSDVNALRGLNVVGLRRAGLSVDERKGLKRLYQLLFRSGLNLREAVARAEVEFEGAAERRLIEFMKSARRGVCSGRGRSPAEPEE